MGLPNLLGRRSLLKLSGGGFLAGTLGGSVAKVPPMLVPADSREMPDVAAAATGREPWRLFDLWREKRAPNAYAYKVRHGSGTPDLDPDIACLRSVSPCMKTYMQRERDLHMESRLALIAKFFGVEHY